MYSPKLKYLYMYSKSLLDFFISFFYKLIKIHTIHTEIGGLRLYCCRHAVVEYLISRGYSLMPVLP